MSTLPEMLGELSGITDKYIQVRSIYNRKRRELGRIEQDLDELQRRREELLESILKVTGNRELADLIFPPTPDQ